MADGVRVVRIILTGDSAGYVKSVELAGAASETAQTKMQKMQSVGRGMTALGRSMTMVGAPIVALGAYAVKSAASFQQSMQLIRTQAGASQGDVNRMSAAVQRLSPTLGTAPGALADSLYHAYSATRNMSESLNIMSTAAKESQISGADLTDTTTALTAAVFSGIKGAQNFRQAMGLLNATVGAGDMHFQDLNEAFAGPMLATVKGYGLSLKDVGSALATFGDLNIRGADAATQLRMAVQYMAKPAASAGPMLSQLGLSTTSFATAMAQGGLLPALKLLHDRLSAAGIKGKQMALAISDLFTKRGAAGVTILENSLGRLESKYGEVSKGATGFGAAWGVTQKNIAFQWNKLKATLETSMIGLGKSLMPLVQWFLPKLITGIKDVVGWITHLPGPVKDVVAGFALFLVIGGPILMFIGSLITAIGTIGTAMAAVGITLDAIPIVAMIAGIGLAIGILITHFQTVKLIAATVFHAIATTVSTVGSFIGNVFHTLGQALAWPFVTAYKIIRGIFNWIIGAVHWVANKVTGAFHAITGVFSGIAHFAGSALNTATFGLLHSGGPVRRRTHFDSGGPVGTDTIPGWLSPGEYVLNRAAAARVGLPALNALNAGMPFGGGDIQITPGAVYVQVQGRTIAEAVVQYTLQRAARGPSSLVGGAMLTGSRTG